MLTYRAAEIEANVRVKIIFFGDVVNAFLRDLKWVQVKPGVFHPELTGNSVVIIFTVVKFLLGKDSGAH